MSILSTQLKPWHPDKPVSKGATAYHDAVVNAPYYIDNLIELVRIVSPRYKENDIVVDFGAGTGVSALHMLKYIKSRINLWLVDNSPAWLGKAYEILKSNPNVNYFLLEKIKDRYATLAETLGEQTVDHVISANTLHLIPNLVETFNGINLALKPQGTFTFQSGNIIRNGREEGVLMVDDTINSIHNIALDIVSKNKKFIKYRKGLNERIRIENEQRKFIFPTPRPVEEYLKALKIARFIYEEPKYKLIKIEYSDWLDFLRVKRLQAGILPEIGSKEPHPEEEQDRDELITMASNQLFKELETQNPMANKNHFTAEWVYVTAIKNS